MILMFWSFQLRRKKNFQAVRIDLYYLLFTQLRDLEELTLFFDFWFVLSFVYVSSWCWSSVIEETTQLCSSLQSLNRGIRIFLWMSKNHTFKLRKTKDWKQVICVILTLNHAFLEYWFEIPKRFGHNHTLLLPIRVLYFIIFSSRDLSYLKTVLFSFVDFFCLLSTLKANKWLDYKLQDTANLATTPSCSGIFSFLL